MKIGNKKRLNNAAGAAITSLALTALTAVYSEAIPVDHNVWFMALLVKEDKSGGAGDVDISAEYSLDGTNFYTAYTTSSGVLTADTLLVEALQNVTRWIIFTPRLAKYMRFKFDPDANSQVTADLLYQEEL
jgi:hypothetical protein